MTNLCFVFYLSFLPDLVAISNILWQIDFSLNIYLSNKNVWFIYHL